MGKTSRLWRGSLTWLKKQFEKNFTKIIVGIAVAVFTSAWGGMLAFVNTDVMFKLRPASTGLVFVNQPFQTILKMSERFCGGGWDNIVKVLTFTTCHRIEFEPQALQNLGICSGSRDPVDFTARDPVQALTKLRSVYKDKRCFLVMATGQFSYQVVPDANAAKVVFKPDGRTPGQSASDRYFCGCSLEMVSAIAADQDSIVER